MDKNENCRLHHETTKELPLTTSMWGLKCETKSKRWWSALDELPWNLNTQWMGIWMMSRHINGYQVTQIDKHTSSGSGTSRVVPCGALIAISVSFCITREICKYMRIASMVIATLLHAAFKRGLHS
jgi:hypothetical protein